MAIITNTIRWADNTKELKQNLLEGIGTLDVMKRQVDRTTESLSGAGLFAAANKTAAAIVQLGGATKLTAAEQERANTVLEKAIEKYKVMGMAVPSAIQAIADSTRQVTPGLKNLSDGVDGVNQKTNQLTTSMVAVGAAVGTFVGHLASNVFQRFVGGIGDVVVGAFKMNASLETTTLKFTTLMGDSDKAASHVKDLFEIAKKTPFETGPIIEASLKLQTFGGAALNTKENIMLLGDASAATGAPINELGFWVGRMYAMLQGGKPFGEAAMRLQEMAVLTPKARDEMEKMQKAGKSGAEIFDTFKGSLSGFTGAMVTQAGTWEGVMSTFTDTVNMMMADVLKPYFEVIRDLGKNVNKALDDMSEKMGDVAKATADTKQGFVDFITTGLNGTIKTVAFLMVELNAAQVVFRDIAQLYEILNLQAAKFERMSAKASDPFGFDAQTQARIKQIDKDIASMTASILARAEALDKDKTSEKDWIAWGDKAIASVAKMTDGLGAASVALEVHKGKVDDAGGAHQRTEKEIKAAAKALKEQVDELDKFWKAVDNVTSHEAHFGQVVAGIDKQVMDGIRFYHDRGAKLSELGTIYRLTAGEIDALDKQFKFEQSVLDATTKAFGGVHAQMTPLVARFGEFHEAVTGLDDETGLLTSTLIDSGTATFNFADQTAYAAKKTEEFQKRLKAMHAETSSLTGVINSLDRILGNISGRFVEVASVGLRAASEIAKIAEKASKAGEALSKGDWLAIAAIGVSALATAFGKLFSNTEKQINPIREAFVQAAGGLGALDRKAAEAGVTLKALLDAKNPEQYKKAVDDLTAAFERQKQKVEEDSSAVGDLLGDIEEVGGTLPAALGASVQALIAAGKVSGDLGGILARITGESTVSFSTLSGIVTKWGGDLKAVGPQFEKARLHDLASQVVNDFDTLERGLGSVDEALGVMKKPIIDLAFESKKAGVDIPANFKPWLEQLARTGQLIDENGDKVEDLSGFKFGEASIKTEFQILIDKLTILIDKISGPSGLAAAVANIPDRTVHVGFEVDRPDGFGFGDESRTAAASGGIIGRIAPRRLAGGGFGTDTVHAMLTPGELVLNVAQQRNVAGALTSGGVGGGGGGGATTVNNWYIQATDVDSFKRLLDREGIPYILDELRHNRRGARSNIAEQVS